MSKKLVIYSKDHCRQCEAVKRRLDAAKVEYETVHNPDIEGIQFLESLNNYRQVPVTIRYEGDEIVGHFYGFDPDSIDDAIEWLQVV